MAHKPHTMEEACQNLASAFLACFELMGSAPQPDDGPKLYTVDELADFLKKSPITVRTWIGNGVFGEIVRVGNSVRVPAAAVEKYISDNTGPTKKQEIKPRKARVNIPKSATERI